ncbi:MAG TPA: sigma-54 dependent transcriptional regulator [Bryobacteraceae bacterium]
MRAGTVLVVEDDESLRRVMQVQLEKEGYKTAVAGDVPQALEVLQQEKQDVVISDLNLPGSSGLELLKRIRVEYPETTTIIVTAYATVTTAVDAMKAGAYDYLTKPVQPYELNALVARALEKQRLAEEVQALRRTIDQKFGFENIIGQSPALMRVLEAAARVAQTNATILIRGETGTGKELLAKAIHLNSARRDRAFVIINCGAIPRELLESELFGHVKGAFTGALSHKKGKVEMADGGTVFLDEIGEMPLDLQVRVLRLIQEHEIEKVGASNPTYVDVRVIAATHRNLEAMVENGTFREDLYYRLVVVPIEIPPLRTRSQDIPELVCEFFNQSTTKYSRKGLRLPQELLRYFSQYHWPGNIRQLQNAIERMVVLCPSDEITPDDLPDFLRHSAAGAHPSLAIPEGMALDAVEREAILQALAKCNWNQTRAAQQLGITRKILMSRIAKYGIERIRSQQLNPSPLQ